MLVVAYLICFIHSCLLSLWLLACYPVMVSLCGFTLIFASLDIVMDIIAQIHACMSCEPP
jgi:hypothetical protein